MVQHRTQPQPADITLQPGRLRRCWQCAGWVPAVLLSIGLWSPVVLAQTIMSPATVLTQFALLLFGVSLWRFFAWPAGLARRVCFQHRGWWWLAASGWHSAPATKPIQLANALALPRRGRRRVWVFADECAPEDWRRLNVWSRFTRQHRRGDHG